MAKLFISFTALLRDFFKDKIQEADLANGLFYFGCVREHVFDTPNEENVDLRRRFRRNPEKASWIMDRIRQALLSAEADGRTAWRQLEERCSYGQLNELLTRNGHEAIEVGPIDDWSGAHYSYPGAVRRVKLAGLALEVIR